MAARAPDLTPEQIAEAERLRKTGDKLHDGRMGWLKISKAMGVSQAALMRHFDPDGLAKKRQRDGKCRIVNLGLQLEQGRIEIPEFVLDERDRVMLAPMDPLAEMLGDPRPGRSALDKKRGAFA